MQSGNEPNQYTKFKARLAVLADANVLTVLILATVVVCAGVFTYLYITGQPRQISEADWVLSSGAATSSPYTDLDGNPLSLRQYEGRVRVVSAWASWCPTCVTELNNLSKLGEKYGNNDVVTIAINRKENKREANAFLNHFGAPAYVLYVLDPTDRFFKNTDGYAMPETLIYDRNGNVVFHKQGIVSLEELKQQTESALAQKSRN